MWTLYFVWICFTSNVQYQLKKDCIENHARFGNKKCYKQEWDKIFDQQKLAIEKFKQILLFTGWRDTQGRNRHTHGMDSKGGQTHWRDEQTWEDRHNGWMNMYMHCMLNFWFNRNGFITRNQCFRWCPIPWTLQRKRSYVTQRNSVIVISYICYQTTFSD